MVECKQKVGKWPKKVGKWPFLKIKVASKTREKAAKNGQKRAILGGFKSFLRKNFHLCKLLAKWPLFLFII